MLASELLKLIQQGIDTHGDGSIFAQDDDGLHEVGRLSLMCCYESEFTEGDNAYEQGLPVLVIGSGMDYNPARGVVDYTMMKNLYKQERRC